MSFQFCEVSLSSTGIHLEFFGEIKDSKTSTSDKEEEQHVEMVFLESLKDLLNVLTV